MTVTLRQLHRTLQKRVAGGVQHSLADGLNYFTGSLWTARQRQGHSLHEISYRACFKPQLPAFFIELLTQPGEIVLDPFMGRGTTPIQSALMQRVAYGSDINPLSLILTEPRLRTPSLSAIEQRLREIPTRARVKPNERELEVFFHPQVLRRLVAMKAWFGERERSGTLDSADKWIRMVAANRLTGHSPGFFSVKTMPPNQAVSLQTQRRINATHGRVPAAKDIGEIIIKKSRRLLRSGALNGGGAHRLRCAPAFELSYIKPGTVSALITSPPFLDMVDYHQDNWLRCWFADIRQDEVHISRHRSTEAWKQFVADCFREFYRIMKPGGIIAFEVGEARKGQVLLEQQVAAAVAALPFKVLAVLVNQQAFTKTANCWGVSNNRQGTNTNRVVLLTKV